MYMNNYLLTILAAFSAASAFADIELSVDPAVEIDTIKPVNAVNCGPTRPSDHEGNFKDYRAANIPYARTHDMNHSYSYGGPHALDMSALFPNFDADENDPKSYDFALTDETLSWMFAAGTEPFFRLGTSIEPWSKNYTIFPPKDNAKWARVAEHVIAHYTEGWANGKKWKITYWEIWNEPDRRTMWTGSPEQFTAFFVTVAKHLKTRFPHLKIGGPAMANPFAFKSLFLRRNRETAGFHTGRRHARESDGDGRAHRLCILDSD